MPVQPYGYDALIAPLTVPISTVCSAEHAASRGGSADVVAMFVSSVIATISCTATVAEVATDAGHGLGGEVCSRFRIDRDDFVVRGNPQPPRPSRHLRRFGSHGDRVLDR